MPNWCFTQMIFHGEKEEITDLHNKITEWTSKNYEENGFGVNWLGNVLHGAGLGDRIDSSSSKFLRCRGNITFFGEVETFKDSTEATFNLDTETAWGPMCLMWKEVIDAMGYKTVGFSYLAEEPGCEVYEVYDPYSDFLDKYHIDIYVDTADEENTELMRIHDRRDYVDDNDLKEALQRFLNTEEEDLKTLIEQIETYPFKSEDTFISVHEYTFVDEPTQ